MQFFHVMPATHQLPVNTQIHTQYRQCCKTVKQWMCAPECPPGMQKHSPPPPPSKKHTPNLACFFLIQVKAEQLVIMPAKTVQHSNTNKTESSLNLSLCFGTFLYRYSFFYGTEMKFPFFICLFSIKDCCCWYILLHTKNYHPHWILTPILNSGNVTRCIILIQGQQPPPPQLTFQRNLILAATVDLLHSISDPMHSAVIQL